jgi:hypothetical protein
MVSRIWPGPTAAAVTLGVAALMLGACGSNDDSGDSAGDASDGDSDRGLFEDYPLIPIGDDDGTPAPDEITADGSYMCGVREEHQVRIVGDGLEVGLGGTCEMVTIDGTGNTVQFASAETVTINGSRHDVSTAQGAGTIVLTGDRHHVRIQEGNGAVRVDDNSLESEIEGNHFEEPVATTAPMLPSTLPSVPPPP